MLEMLESLGVEEVKKKKKKKKKQKAFKYSIKRFITYYWQPNESFVG